MNLKIIRKSKDLTVPELSHLSGVPVRTIEDVERMAKAEYLPQSNWPTCSAYLWMRYAALLQKK